MGLGQTAIEDDLQQVRVLRDALRQDPALADAVRAIKAYQHRRLERSYADLLAQPRYATAARFFLDDLYGPRDFSDRDAQFARIVPTISRVFPQDVLQTVATLARLHALSERMDVAMGRACLQLASPLDGRTYARAWQVAGDPQAREEQVTLMLSVGHDLERLVRLPLLRGTLRVMRRPAQAAGLGALQAFLERGFTAFADMKGADDFLGTIAARERALSAALFDWSAEVSPLVTSGSVLGQLP